MAIEVSVVGFDIAKNVFQVHGVDRRGAAVLRRRLRRAQVAEFFRQLRPCLVGMEATRGAHYWARVLRAFGHEVRLIAPQFVKPFLKSQKNDANDAEAICEAVNRPNMRFEAKVVAFLSFGEALYGGPYYDTQRLENVLKAECLLALRMNGQPLPDVYGAPLRLRVENQLGYKMIKWIERIEFIQSEKQLGEGEGGKNEDDEYFDLLPNI
jgi:transposase